MAWSIPNKIQTYFQIKHTDHVILCVYTHTCIHTIQYIHTYIHTYIHACMHACIPWVVTGPLWLPLLPSSSLSSHIGSEFPEIKRFEIDATHDIHQYTE
jgi:hypothetical protein